MTTQYELKSKTRSELLPDAREEKTLLDVAHYIAVSNEYKDINELYFNQDTTLFTVARPQNK